VRAFAAAALVLLVACDSATAPQSAILGTWNLQTVNGAFLPYTVSGSGANRTDMISNMVTFSSSGAFSVTAVRRTWTNSVPGALSTTNSTGTYTVNGSTISITTEGETGVETATLNDAGDTLTTTGGGLTLVFKKE
jgi:hypothetical protein